MKKIKVQIKGKEKIIIKLLKSLKIDIYDINYINNKSIYTIKSIDFDRIPKSLVIKKSISFKDYIYIHKEYVISLLIGIILMVFLSHVIFSIKIMHNDKRIREITSVELKKYGLKPFTFRKKYKDLDVIKKKILNDHKDIYEWIEIIPKGMTYIVRVEERIISKEEKTSEYCDLISIKDAVIRSISASKGQNVLDAGDYVKKGQTIVSGDIMFNESIKDYVCAEGIVYGNTWYNVSIKYPRYKYKKIYTGRKSYNLKINDLPSIFNIHFKEYDLKSRLIFKIGKVKVYKQIALEYKSKRIKLSLDEAKEGALSLARRRLLQGLKPNSKIINQNVLQSYEYNSIINMDIFYSVDEVISLQEIKSVKREKEEG